MKLDLLFRYALSAIAFLLVPTTTMAEEAGWVALTDISAWRGYQMETVPATWQTDADGVLTLIRSEDNPEAVDLVTKEQYGNFDFRFDWKIAPGGNSGVMYRVTEEKEQPYYTGPEYQVLDDAGPGYDALDKNQLVGSLYGLYARSAEVTRPAGEWNTSRIVLKGNAVEHWLNGEKVVSAQMGSEDWNQRIAGTKFAPWERFGKNARGHIVLQDHGAQVWYRNLRVRPLKEEAKGASTSSSKRLLLVTQSEGYEHSTITRQSNQPNQLSHTERLLTELGVRSGAFRVDCTKDVAKDFTPELLANYDMVAFYTTGDLPIPAETLDWFLTTYLAEEGHGFLGLHSATDTFMEHPLFRDMIGGTFNGHPWTKDTEVVLKIHDGDHPASRPWGNAGDRFEYTDEIYQYNHWQPKKARVLMSLDMERTDLKRPYHVPVLWVKPYGTGRVMNMSLGHREATWENPTYQASLLGGILWLLGEEPGDATPNPKVSAAEEMAAKAATEPATVGS